MTRPKRTDADKGHRQVSDADYEKNLETLVARMKKTGAKLIFCHDDARSRRFAGRSSRATSQNTTKSPCGVMKKHGVAIDDLYAFALPQLAEIQLPANVHFKPEGSKQLAEQVAASILKILESK